jgi:valyl-tRNA synthetase
VKKRLWSEDEEDKKVARFVLVMVLKNMLELLHPFMPFITEEIWSYLPHETDENVPANGYLIRAPWPVYSESRNFPAEEAILNKAMEAVTAVRNIRAEAEAAPSRKLTAVIVSEGETMEQLKAGDLSAGHARALLGLTDPEKIVPLSNRIIAKNLSVRETEVLVKRENIAPAPELPDIEGKPQNRAYMMDLERRTRETLGRKVKITQNNKKKSIELYYEDDADMEALLLALCGPDFFNEEL